MTLALVLFKDHFCDLTGQLLAQVRRPAVLRFVPMKVRTAQDKPVTILVKRLNDACPQRGRFAEWSIEANPDEASAGLQSAWPPRQAVSLEVETGEKVPRYDGLVVQIPRNRWC